MEIGSKLGHFEILEPLGAGGMGEVYRAHDTSLKREVAIKVLPEAMAADQERLARLEREAHLLASLNHPHIASIHSLEREEDTWFLVLELVEGETLAERLERGPLPVEEALETARQIAEALEAAHGKGIIHRDLKPANVKVTPEGKVKVLDFGLAKAYEAEGPAAEISPDLTESPTVAAATRTGVILGTAAYMSPEQAKGKPLDKRTDIFSFGCVLYEMFTGRRPFVGEDVSDTLAAILRDEPDWSALPPGTPPLAASLLRRCLRKDPNRRLHDIADVRIEIDEALHEPLGDLLSVRQEPTFRRRSIEYALGGVAAGLVAGLLAAFWFGSTILRGEPEGASLARRPTTAGVVRVADGAPVAYGTAAIGYDSPLIAVSPDGNWLVYVGESEGQSRLYRQDLGGFEEAEPIPGTEGAIYAFFSPNGQSVGFLTDEQMKRVSLRGDDLQTICDVRTAVRASWTNDDWIYFAENEGILLRRVAASGGEIEEVAGTLQGTLSDVDPDGTMALYSIWSRGISSDYDAVHLLDLETLEDEVLLESAYDARFLPTGHLVFGRGGNLLAVRFDPAARQVVGDPITVMRNVAMDSLFSHVQVAVSAAGTLAYLAGGDRAIGRIASVDRQGQERFLPLEPRLYGVLDLAPDDKRLAFHVADVNDSVWIYDPERDERRELTGGGIGGWPVWNHRGDTVAFASGLSGQPGWELKTQGIDGGEPARTVFTGNRMIPSDWSPVGDVIAISDWAIDQPNVGFLTINEQPSVQWIDSPGVTQWGVAFSPDGNWFAYASDQTGQLEIWVRSRADTSTARQVSLDGGLEPVWCQCNEIFFRRGKQWLAAAVLPGSELDWESPRVVFEVDDFIETPGISYDVSSDGQLLYVVKRAEPAVRSRIQVLSNWFDDLERLVPTEVRQ